MTDDLRARICVALLAVNHPYEPDELARIPDSQSVAARVGDLADAVMAVLDTEMPRLHRLWLQAQADGHGGLVDLTARDVELDGTDPDVCPDCYGVGYDIGGPEHCTTCGGNGRPAGKTRGEQ
jgi:hypothetical protein